VTSVVLVVAFTQPTEHFKTAAAPPPSQDVVAAVRDAVAASQRADPIPTALSPGVAASLTDFKGIGSCSGYHATSSRICQFGDATAREKLVLFGDSHSTMWLPALDELTLADHWQLFPVVKEACGYSDYIGPAQGQCAQWYAWALQQLTSIQPDVIVVGSYTLRGWAVGLTSVLTALKARGTRVVVLSDAPGLPEAPEKCLVAPGATQATCSWPQNASDLAADQEAAVIARNVGAEFVDVAPWFCYAGVCPAVVHSIITYADGGHLTGTYARYLGPELGRALRLV
jgi:hypothetical protein